MRNVPENTYGVRGCDIGGGRPHWHVTRSHWDLIAESCFLFDIVLPSGKFTFETEGEAQTEARRLNGLALHDL